MECRTVADLADDDPVGRAAEREPDEVGERHARVVAGALACAKREVVFGAALQLGRVLEHDDPLARVLVAHLQQDRVAERRLAGARPAADEDVLVVAHSGLDGVFLLERHHARVDVVRQTEHAARRLTDHEAGAGHDGRHEALKAGPAERRRR